MEALATTNGTSLMLPETVLEMVTASGDLGKLSLHQRQQYITALCQSMGLNALSRPIELINLNGKTVPYAKKDCTDQLRKLHRISISIVGRESLEGVYTVTARAITPEGRTDEDVGAVTIANLKGDNLANATMKAHTKAKRRVTLSICGLGILDELELETVSSYRPVAEPAITPVTVRPETAPAETARAEPAMPADDELVEFWAERFESATTADDVVALSAECKTEIPRSDKTLSTLLAISPYVEKAKKRTGGK